MESAKLLDYAELFISRMLNSKDYKLSVKVLDNNMNNTKTVVLKWTSISEESVVHGSNNSRPSFIIYRRYKTPGQLARDRIRQEQYRQSTVRKRNYFTPNVLYFMTFL